MAKMKWLIFASIVTILLMTIQWLRPLPAFSQGTCPNLRLVETKYFPGHQVAPNQQFTVTWTVENNGNCTWTSEYKIGYIRGEHMGEVTPFDVPLLGPGETHNIVLSRVAPTRTQDFEALWKMFTFVPYRNYGDELKIQIQVVPIEIATANAATEASQTAAAIPSATPDSSQIDNVTATALAVQETQKAVANQTVVAIASETLQAVANGESTASAKAAAQANANATSAANAEGTTQAEIAARAQTTNAIATTQAEANTKGTADAHANETAQANARATQEANAASNAAATANANATATAQKNVDASATPNAAVTASATATATATAIASDPVSETVRSVRDFMQDNPLFCIGPLGILLVFLLMYILWTLIKPKKKIADSTQDGKGQGDAGVIQVINRPHLTSPAIPKGFELANPTIIGTSERANLVVPAAIAGAASVSAEHARLEKRGARWLIRDGDAEGRQSKTGIFVNGKRTRVNYLQDGDKIRLGDVEFIFHDAPQGAKQ